jgi:hypothetical protein
MKKYIILFILLFGAGIAISDIDTFEGTATDSLSDIEGSTVAAGGGSEWCDTYCSSGVFCEDLDGESDETNLVTLTGWTGDDADDIEVDTAIKNPNGSNEGSIKITFSGTGRSGIAAITPKDAMQLHIKFWMYVPSGYYTTVGDTTFFLFLQNSSSATQMSLRVKNDSGDIDVEATPVTLNPGDAISYDTWYFAVIELDLVNDTYDMWFDTTDSSPTKQITGQALDNGGAFEEFYLYTAQSAGDAGDVMHIADVCIMEGSYD